MAFGMIVAIYLGWVLLVIALLAVSPPLGLLALAMIISGVLYMKAMQKGGGGGGR